MQPQPLIPPEPPRGRPLLVTSSGRAIESLPFTRREDDLELRKLAALPLPESVDPDRPTVIVLDRALLAKGISAETVDALSKRAALLGVGDAGQSAPDKDWPADHL